MPYFGCSAPNASDWDDKQAKYSPAITRVFFQPGDGLDWTSGLMARILATTTSQAVYVSFKDWSEASVTAFITKAKTMPQRMVFLSWHHEPEGDVSFATFQANHARMRQLWAAAGSPANVKIAMTLMGVTYRSAGSNPEDWYVDTTLVNGEPVKVFDILCADQYDSGYKKGTYADFAKQNTELVAMGVAHGLPIGFGELGTAVGPKRTTDLPARRAYIKSVVDWCTAHAGTGPGQVWVASYWDVTSNAVWASGTAEYAKYGAISQNDYRIQLDPPLRAKSPGTLAGQVAYGGPDPLATPIWRTPCQLSRAFHGID